MDGTQDVLARLLAAPSREFVESLLSSAFRYRLLKDFPAKLVETSAAALAVSPAEAQELLDTLATLTTDAFFMAYDAAEIATQLLPADLKPELRNLISNLLGRLIVTWQQDAAAAKGSADGFFPKLENFAWRVDLITASDQVVGVAAPTVVASLKVRPPGSSSDAFPPVENVEFELNKETLETMLAGLGKIREQLSAIAGQP